MILSIVTTDLYQHKRLFVTSFEKLEDAFTFLNHVVNKGHTLFSAKLIDNDQSMKLPVAAFDGVSLLPVLEQLESTWASILAKPRPARSRLDGQPMHWCRKRIDYYEQHIIDLESLITSLNSRCQAMTPQFKIKHEVVFVRYQSVLGRYASQLDKAHFLRIMLFDQLERSPD